MARLVMRASGVRAVSAARRDRIPLHEPRERPHAAGDDPVAEPGYIDAYRNCPKCKGTIVRFVEFLPVTK
jgi:hypothetical protein